MNAGFSSLVVFCSCCICPCSCGAILLKRFHFRRVASLRADLIIRSHVGVWKNSTSCTLVLRVLFARVHSKNKGCKCCSLLGTHTTVGSLEIKVSCSLSHITEAFVVTLQLLWFQIDITAKTLPVSLPALSTIQGGQGATIPSLSSSWLLLALEDLLPLSHCCLERPPTPLVVQKAPLSLRARL